MRRLGTYLALAAAHLGVAAASAQEALTADEFCAMAEESAQARRTCESDYRRSLELFLQYAREEGYVDAEGDFSFGRVFGDLWSWRTIVGLPPASPFLDCTNMAEKVAGAYDYRAIWDCIAARDPRAARKDAI